MTRSNSGDDGSAAPGGEETQGATEHEESPAVPQDPPSYGAAPPGPSFWLEPGPPAQAAPPGPAFWADQPRATEHEEPLPGAAPPGPAFGLGEQPAPGQAAPPGPSFLVTESASESVEGPAPDLREPWLRRVLRRRRDRGPGDA